MLNLFIKFNHLKILNFLKTLIYWSDLFEIPKKATKAIIFDNLHSYPLKLNSLIKIDLHRFLLKFDLMIYNLNLIKDMDNYKFLWIKK
jgi:hypothetical protein